MQKKINLIAIFIIYYVIYTNYSCNNKSVKSIPDQGIGISPVYTKIVEEYIMDYNIDSTKCSLVVLINNTPNSDVTNISLYPSTTPTVETEKFCCFGYQKIKGIRILYCSLNKEFPLIKIDSLPQNFVLDYRNILIDYPMRHFIQNDDSLIRLM